MKLTKNFNLYEFACRDGTQVPDEYLGNVKVLSKNLQVLRDYLDEPITINSSYRHTAYNKRIGGAKASQHLTASAADITTKGRTPKQVKAAILKLIKEGKMHNGGIGLYPGFVHYDIRSTPARW